MSMWHVERTSVWDNKIAPCEEATRRPYTRVDERTFKTFAEHDAKWPRPWESEGHNHRVTETGIARDFDDTDWFVDFETADDLLAFLDKYDQCVVGRFMFNEEIREIEIYDTWRE